jgi:hypothetical protein
MGFKLTTSVVIGTDSIGSCESPLNETTVFIQEITSSATLPASAYRACSNFV